MTYLKTTLIILVAWQIASMLLGNEYILPGIDTVVGVMPELFTDIRFLSAVADTVLFLLKSWIVIGFILFLLMLASVKFASVRDIIKSLCISLQPTPTFAWMPIFMLIVGVNELTLLLLMVFSTIWMVGLNLVSGIETAIDKWQKHCENLKMNLYNQLVRVYFPSVKKLIVSSLKTTWNLSWRILIAIEVAFGSMGNHWGIGTYMTDAKDVMETSTMYAVFFIIILFGILFDFVFDRIFERKGYGS